MAYHLLIVDDDPAVTSLLRRGFSYEGYKVTIASNGTEALQAAREKPPDLVVLDIMMPEVDGLEVCRRLRRDENPPPILFLTGKDASHDEVTGLEAGADDYVVKPFSFEVLNARVSALLRRRDAQPPQVLRYQDLRLDVAARVAYRGHRKITMTTTEFKLLRLLLLHPRRVLTKEQIIDQVWGNDFGGGANIVEVYVRSLRIKLEAEGEPRLVQTVRGAGYALREE